MAAATRRATSAKKEVLHRIFKDILELPDDSNLHKACEHDDVDGILALLNFSPLEVVDMTYLDGTTRNKISKGHAGKVFALQAIFRKRNAEEDPIHDDWLNVTLKEFDNFRVSSDYISARTGLPNPTATRSNISVAPTTAKPRDPLSDFRRGVRRDPNLYIALKEDKQWDSWQRSTIAQARAQG